MNNYIKCKECPFYTGIQCHGHGEFWGECNLIKLFIKVHKLDYKKYDVWSDTCGDLDRCKLSDILKLKVGEEIEKK